MQHIALLYEGALGFVRKCRKLRSEGKLVEGGREAAKAQAILTELTLHLDRRAGELTDTFKDHYQAVYSLIAKGQLQEDDSSLKQAEDILENLVETWQEAMKEFRKGFYGP